MPLLLVCLIRAFQSRSLRWTVLAALALALGRARRATHNCCSFSFMD